MRNKICGSILALLALFGVIKHEHKPSEYEGRKYKLKANTKFYRGEPPTRNQSGIHGLDVYVLPCFVLVFKEEFRGYLVFTVAANTCAMDENIARNGETVYYKKELFKNLGKYELT